MESIPLPDGVTVARENGNETTFEIAPYYPGYGPTIGNALRRVLLSSLPGAAVTAVRMEGVDHEFSAIPGVMEDVVSILLNLKRLRFRLHRDTPVEVRLTAQGVTVVRGSDVEKNSDVEVVNPDHVIAHLTDSKAKLDLLLTLQRGRGYLPVEAREQEDRTLGTIAVDAIYTPVERVSFSVENVRVGQETEFHKLIITVRTDGSVSPKEALTQAASILQDHFGTLAADAKERLTYRREVPAAEQVVLPQSPVPVAALPPEVVRPEPAAVEERLVTAPIEAAVRAPEERVRDPKALAIVEFPVSTRIQNMLEKEGIRTIAGLILKTRSQLLGIPGLGEKALEEVEAALTKLGLTLREERPAGESMVR